MRKKVVLIGAIAALAFAYACSKGEGESTTPVSFEGPIASTDVEKGAEVYATYCEGCHPGGAAGDGPAITGLNWAPAAMRNQIRTGTKDMPSFDTDKISDQELEALLAFTVTLDATAPQ
jgi:mono/diheme cytochrome c family protein